MKRKGIIGHWFDVIGKEMENRVKRFPGDAEEGSSMWKLGGWRVN